MSSIRDGARPELINARLPNVRELAPTIPHVAGATSVGRPATAGFGIASWSAEAGIRGPAFEDVRIRFDGTETDFVFGLGVEGKINEAITARLEFLGLGDFDVDIVRAGLNFKLCR
jgi:hypothetical protein